MNLVENPTLNPSVCTLCGTKPPDTQWVDTLQELNLPFPFPLGGRKYVCGDCGGEIAKLLGYEKSDQILAALRERDEASQKASDLVAQVKGFAKELSFISK